MSDGRNIISPEDELEQLIAEKDQRPLKNLDYSPPSHYKKRVSDEEIEQQLEQLVLEKDQMGMFQSRLDNIGPDKSQMDGQRDKLSSMSLSKEQHDKFSSGMFGREGQSFVKVQESSQFMAGQIEKKNMSQLLNKENLVESWKETKDYRFESQWIVSPGHQ